MAPTITPVAHDPKGLPGKTTIVVTAADGKKYDVQLALIVLTVADLGTVNPLDGMPMFQIASQIVTQVGKHIDA